MSNHHNDLARTMRELYASEINCGMSSFWDAGFEVWLGDDMNGRKVVDTNLYPGDLDAAARLLHEAALRLYPDSEYARRWAALAT